MRLDKQNFSSFKHPPALTNFLKSPAKHKLILFPGLLPHKGNTRNPEKVEYFQPPIRLPLSSLR